MKNKKIKKFNNYASKFSRRLSNRQSNTIFIISLLALVGLIIYFDSVKTVPLAAPETTTIPIWEAFNSIKGYYADDLKSSYSDILKFLSTEKYIETTGSNDNDQSYVQELNFIKDSKPVSFLSALSGDVSEYVYQIKFKEGVKYDSSSGELLNGDFISTNLVLGGDKWSFTDVSSSDLSKGPDKLHLINDNRSIDFEDGRAFKVNNQEVIGTMVQIVNDPANNLLKSISISYILPISERVVESHSIEQKIEEAKVELRGEIKNASCASGCISNNICYSMGYRLGDGFCSDSNAFASQRPTDSFCNNGFECQSNLCVSNSCLNQNFLEKLIEWLKKLFGQ